MNLSEKMFSKSIIRKQNQYTGEIYEYDRYTYESAHHIYDVEIPKSGGLHLYKIDQQICTVPNKFHVAIVRKYLGIQAAYGINILKEVGR